MFVTSHANYDRPIQSVGKLKDGSSHIAQISVVLIKIELSRSSGNVRSSLEGPFAQDKLDIVSIHILSPLKKPLLK